MSATVDTELPVRSTRQRAKEGLAANCSSRVPSRVLNSAKTSISITTAVPIPTPHPAVIKPLPVNIMSELVGLPKTDLDLLHAKQLQLRNSKIQRSFNSGKGKLITAAEATLVFGQEEAGTAVCISPEGLLLTCSHCVAESPEELEAAKTKCLLFASGQIVQAECIAWDPKRDLALLQIIAAQLHSQLDYQQASPASANVARPFIFPFVRTADRSPPLRTALICIGHPGSEDLEVSQSGVKTGYDVLHISSGLFRGYAPDQDLQNNSEIGALKHDCWTYWGHSGAPLVHRASGHLIGLHSSWDEHTAMRRGIPLEAIRQFLQQQTVLLISKQTALVQPPMSKTEK